MPDESPSFPASRTFATLLTALALAHFFLALWFASNTPYRAGGLVRINPSVERDIGAPDERQHANYVARLLRGEGFPVFNPQDPDLYETYQSHQPPIYYVLAAGWSRLGGHGATDLTDPSGSGGVWLRSLNGLIGASTVIGVFFLGWWGFARREVGLIAATFVALLPMNVALSGAISNDPLLIALCTWVLALCAKGIRRGWNVPLALTIGVLTGLALLTKTTALALIPPLLVAAFARRDHRPNPKVLLAVALPAILLAVPWWLRNQSLYGDPLAIRAFNEAFTHTAQKSTIEQIAQIQNPGKPPSLAYWIDWVGWWTARSFFGVFGYMDIWLNETGRPTGNPPNALYRLLIAGMLLAFVGWILSLRELDRPAQTANAMNVALFLVVAALFLRFNAQYFQAQARYLFPALGPIACGVGLGLSYRKRLWPVALALLFLTLGGTTLYAGSRLPDEFARRTAPSASQG